MLNELDYQEQRQIKKMIDALREEEERKLRMQQQPQQGGGMNPGMAMNIGQKFMGGGGAAEGAGSAGDGEGMLASAGPWAALAATVVANESSARDAGRRDDRKATHLMDALSGKVLEQDAEYYGDKVGGAGGRLIRGAGKIGHPEGQFEFGKKGIENMFTPWKIFS